jgi:hypothetical protein
MAWADYTLLALVGYFLVSTFTHDWQFLKYLPISRLLFFYLMPLGMYWIARQASVDHRQLRGTWAFLAVFGIYLSITAVAETQQQFWLVWPKYIVSPEFAEFFGRGRGPFLNPVGMGIWIPVCLFSALMWWPHCGRFGRGVIVAVATAGLLGTYATLTRSCWMGLAAGLALVVGLSVPARVRVVLLGSGLLFGTIALAANWENFMAFKRDKDVSAADVAESAKLRPILATVAWNMFVDRPVFGHGFGQYRNEYLNYIDDRTGELPIYKAKGYVQHNVFLAMLCDTGAVGVVLLVAVLAGWTRWAWRLWSTQTAPQCARQQGLLMLGALGAYLPNAMFHDVSIIAMVNMLMFYLAGLTMGLAMKYVPVAAGSPAALTVASSATPRLASLPTPQPW